MGVYTIRLPDALREKMKNININWSEEIRNYIKMRIEEFERKKKIEDALNKLKGRKGVEKGFSAQSVREDHERK